MKNPIVVKVFACKQCSMALNHFDFLKDADSGQPIYYKYIAEDEAVIFCSPTHSSDWYQENKEKIWDKKKKTST